jgi:hypothetical protein
VHDHVDTTPERSLICIDASYQGVEKRNLPVAGAGNARFGAAKVATRTSARCACQRVTEP